MSGKTTIAIECVHAAKWYGQIIAVNDVSLRVGAGVTGLLGPNGAGKSTLLKMMVGQVHISTIRQLQRTSRSPISAFSSPGLHVRSLPLKTPNAS